ncbi:hypothetical protein M9Y10_043028 [Tritrichomonas musculus]|uniref:Uncharacterized protein n=1 Tax=Tritrichomonas musculus TaxID=1915356 RepID=A0ABR2JZQ4_9EUKA
MLLEISTKQSNFIRKQQSPNNPQAQCILGIYYYERKYIQQNIKKGIDLLYQSSINRCISSYFILGSLNHEGKNIKRDINKSIHFYKEASNFNNQIAKNNLGVIYKYCFDNGKHP